MGKVVEILFYSTGMSTCGKDVPAFEQTNNKDFIKISTDDGGEYSNPSIQIKLSGDPQLRIVDCKVFRREQDCIPTDENDCRMDPALCTFNDPAGRRSFEITPSPKPSHGWKLLVVMDFNKDPDTPFEVEYRMPPDQEGVGTVKVT